MRLRDAMIFTRMLCGVICIISSFVRNLPGVIILRAIVFLLDHMNFMSYLPVYSTYLVGPDYVSLVSNVGIWTCDMLGIMVSAGVAYIFPDWRHYNWLIGGLMILQGIYFFVIPYTFQAEYTKGNV